MPYKNQLREKYFDYLLKNYEKSEKIKDKNTNLNLSCAFVDDQTQLPCERLCQ